MVDIQGLALYVNGCFLAKYYLHSQVFDLQNKMPNLFPHIKHMDDLENYSNIIKEYVTGQKIGINKNILIDPSAKVSFKIIIIKKHTKKNWWKFQPSQNFVFSCWLSRNDCFPTLKGCMVEYVFVSVMSSFGWFQKWNSLPPCCTVCKCNLLFLKMLHFFITLYSSELLDIFWAKCYVKNMKFRGVLVACGLKPLLHFICCIVIACLSSLTSCHLSTTGCQINVKKLFKNMIITDYNILCT